MLMIFWRKALSMNFARRLAMVIGIMTCGLSALTNAASWTIELTNGRELTTTRVWEEGDEVKFSAAQGTAGVPRALVKRITSSARNVKPENENRQEARAGQSVLEKKDDGDMKRQEGTTSADREAKLALKSQLDDARKKYSEASISKNSESQQGALDAIKEVSTKLYALADKVKGKYGGELPAWWNE
jgi:DNA polymerase sigma